MRALQMALTKTAISALALFITGCATLSPSIPPGASKADVEMVLGKPVDVVTAPGGEVVWQYARPVGQTTYMVGVRVDGRAKGIRQALTWENLAGIRLRMTGDEVWLAPV
jgi:hypothetical protein